MSHPPSLVLVVIGVVLAMASQLGTAVSVTSAANQWLERLQPAPPPVAVIPTTTAAG